MIRGTVKLLINNVVYNSRLDFGCLMGIQYQLDGKTIPDIIEGVFDDNIEIIHGNAAAVIDSLPVPDKVFIGGSGGELEYIFSSILKKNPYVHIVVTAVTLETLNNTISLMEKNGMNVLDIVQIAVTEVKKRGRYHMMSANNPVFIIEGRGAK